jgi:hypothetical protein
VTSAGLATLLFVLSWLDFREVSALLEESDVADVAATLREGQFGAGIRNTGEVAMRAVRRDEQ